MEEELVVLALDLVAMELGQVELVLEGLAQVVFFPAFLALVMELLAQDQAGLEPVLGEQDWEFQEQDLETLDQVLLAQDQVLMDLVEQDPLLVCIHQEVNKRGKGNHQNRV